MQLIRDNMLLAELYGCADNPQKWVAILDKVCSRLGAVSVALQVFRKSRTGELALIWSARDSFSLRHAVLHDKWVNNNENPRLDIAVQSQVQIMRDEEAFSPDCPRFRRFLQRLQNAGLGKAIMLDVQITPDLFTSLVIHRGWGDERPFDADAEQFLQLFAPHLSQCIQLSEKMRQLQSHNLLLSRISNQLNFGVLVLDQAGHVIWSNETVKGQHRYDDFFVIHNEQMVFKHPLDQRIFRGCLSEVLSLHSSGIRTINLMRSGTGETLELMLTPTVNNSFFNIDASLLTQQYVIAFFKCQDDFALTPVELKELFSLSPAEADLAIAVALGTSVADFAEHKGISVGTARIQLKSIFLKMGISKQTELVQRLWSSVSANILPQN